MGDLLGDGRVLLFDRLEFCVEVLEGEVGVEVGQGVPEELVLVRHCGYSVRKLL